MPKTIVSKIVDSNDEPEVEKLRDELEQERAKMSILALKEFEEKKAELLKSIKDVEKREEIDELIQSGEDLERVKNTMSIIESGIKYGQSDSWKKRKLTGQASLESYPTGKQVQEWDSVEDMVNDIYDNLEKQIFLKEMGKNYSADKLKHYQNLADRLLNSMIKGFKNRDSVNVGKMTIMRCRSCGKILLHNESVCPVCGKKVMVGGQGGW